MSSVLSDQIRYSRCYQLRGISLLSLHTVQSVITRADHFTVSGRLASGIFVIPHYSYKTNTDTKVPGFVQFGGEEGIRNFTVSCSKSASHIAPHEAVGLPGGALVGLSSEKEGEGHDVFWGLYPLAVVLEDRTGVLCIRLGDEIGEDWAGY